MAQEEGGATGRTVGAFRLHEEVGRGGMGVVYRATGPGGTVAAVKLLVTVDRSDEARRRRFEREARVRIDHPNICRVLDAGADADGTPYIAFEMLQGENLAARLRRGRLPVADVVALGSAVCAGLAAAHGEGIIHRDLKPSNLFLCNDGTLKLFDFGIALWSDGDRTRMTRTGALLGTPWYLSPEQARGDRHVDARADLWALGAVLFEAVSGRPPFARETALASIVAVLTEPPPPLPSLAPHCPASLAAAIERALCKAPEERWPTAEAFAEALARVDPAAAADAPPRPTAVLPPGEQRVVAVLLAEEVRDVAALERAVTDQGGSFLPLLGDRALGLFGGEAWEGDEALRAATAALRCRAAAAHLSLASGRVAASGAGISGAALRTAEGACGIRRPGVVVDAAVARLLTAGFTLREADPGLFELLEARAPSALPSAAPPEDETLGRQAELAQMRQAVETVCDEGRAVCLLVTGPPGCGKTRLGRELERMLAESDTPIWVGAGRGEPIRRETAFSLMASVLEGRARASLPPDGPSRLDPGAPLDVRRAAVNRLASEATLDGRPPDWTEAFGELLGVPARDASRAATVPHDPQLIADRFRVALCGWFEGLCRRGPAALLLEDLQWADRASLDLVGDLLELLAEQPLLVFATARDELAERGAEPFAGRSPIRMRLRGLGAADVGRLASGLLGRSLGEAAARAIAERTAGNPLFVREISLALRERGEAVGETGDLPLPLTVEAAVQSRLDHLLPAEKDLCKHASVLGRPFTAREIAATGAAGGEPLLGALVRKEILAGRPRAVGDREREYRFRSSLVADVAYRMLADERREDLHRRAAAFLAGTPQVDPEEVASHHERAGETADAADWFARAALAAAERGDSPRVVRCAERSFRLGSKLREDFPLRLAYAEALGFVGRRDAQVVGLDRALGQAPGPAERSRVRLRQAEVLWRSGRREEALAVARSAADEAREAAALPDLATARGWLVGSLVALGRTAEAEAARTEAEAALAAAAAAGEDVPPQIRAFLASRRALLAAATGDLARRLEALREAAGLYREAQDVRRAAWVEANLADVHNRFGAYEEAIPALREAREGCRRVGNRTSEGYAAVNLAYSLTMSGHPREALAVLDQAEAIARAASEAHLGLMVHLYRSRALLAGGGPGRALAEALGAAGEAERLGARDWLALALAVAARAELAAGRAAEALEPALQALALRDELGSVEEDEAEIFLAAAGALAAGGRTAEAGEVRRRGRARLAELAEKIRDPGWRERFRCDVAAHRELLGDGA